MQPPAGSFEAICEADAVVTELSTRPLTEGLARGKQAGGEEALSEGLRRLCEGGPWIYAAFWQHRIGRSLGSQADSRAGAFSQHSERQSGKLSCTLFHSKMLAAEAGRGIDYEALSLALARLRMLEFEKGEGILGEAADSSEGDRWLSTSPSGYRVRPAVATGGSDKGDDHWRAQFAAGLETVLLTSFQGCLLQLGSIEKLQEDPAIAVQACTVFLPYFAAALSSALDLPNPHAFINPPTSERYDEFRYPFGTDGAYPPRSSDYFPQARNDLWKPPARNVFGPANPFVPSKHSSRLPGGGSFFRGGSPSVLPVTRSPAGQYRDRPNPAQNGRSSLHPFTGAPQSARSTWSDGQERNAPLQPPACAGPDFGPSIYQRLLEKAGQVHTAAPSLGTSQFDLNAPSPSPTWFPDLGQSLEDSYGGFQGRAGSDGQPMEESYGSLRGLNGSGGPRDALTRLAETVADVQQKGSDFGVSPSPGVSRRANDLLGRLESRNQGASPWQGAPSETQTRFDDGMFNAGATDYRESRGGSGAAHFQGGDETALDWGSREEAFRLQESFLRLQEQLEQRTRERRPFFPLAPGHGRQTSGGMPLLEHEGLVCALKGEAAAQEVRFTWNPASADETGQQRHSPVQQPGQSDRPEGGFGYEEIYTPRTHAERGAQDDSSGGERSLLSHSHSSRESDGGAERTRGAGFPYAGRVGRAWNNDPATPSRRQLEMETIFENEPVALRPWEKGRQTWYSNLEHLRSLVPNTSQLKLEDLLDRAARHISELRSQIASDSNKGRPEPFRGYTVLPWRVSEGKTLAVEELSSAQLILVEAYFESETGVPQLAKTLCTEGRELCFMLVEAVGKSTRARFVVKVIDAISTEDLLSSLEGR
ncbi:hypothetical protein KFL_007030020 [Klebsormidium nitens]|uniref:Transcription factor MYC/MYB N-terminal domain-containing protein n=1 Tax=Klebsormidium nitens TaxID=105231 RepID=A0A1Y1IN97_KLENI|nr:hypothetical protein KFL_007030020 [Klebsormidium nitens]|eukprot:GAQ90929.1 hypothetical protein KFL_007030020 [Klebsormidium nitens]